VLPAEPAPDGIVVTIDGERVEAPGAPRTVDPGKHRVMVSAPGKESWSTMVETRADGTASLVSAPLLRDAAAAAVGGGAERDVEKPHRRGTALIAIGFSVGGAAMLTGIGFGVAALSQMSDLKDQCPNKVCPPGNSTYSSTNTFATIADIAFPIAAVGFTVGIIGLVQRGSSGTSEKQEPQTSLWIGPGSIGARGSF